MSFGGWRFGRNFSSKAIGDGVRGVSVAPNTNDDACVRYNHSTAAAVRFRKKVAFFLRYFSLDKFVSSCFPPPCVRFYPLSFVVSLLVSSITAVHDNAQAQSQMRLTTPIMCCAYLPNVFRGTEQGAFYLKGRERWL